MSNPHNCNLKQHRIAACMTLRELSAAIGFKLSKESLATIELGKMKLMSKYVMEVAQVLHVAPEALTPDRSALYWKEYNAEDFYQRLRSAMIDKRLTNRELADRTGVSFIVINKLSEPGRFPTGPVFTSITSVLGMNAESTL